MEKNLENPKEQIKLANESSVSEPIAVGKSKAASLDDDLDLDLDLDEDIGEQEDPEGEPDDAEPEDELEENEQAEPEPEEEPEQPPAKKKMTPAEREIVRQKRLVKQLEQEKAEMQRKLEEREAKKAEEQELFEKYSEDYDEAEARKRAKADVKQSTLEKQLELLMFERQNRKVLSQYPDADADLDKIMKAASTSGMTVEQVCRGLYGVQRTEKELRALRALTDDAPETVNNSVSRSMRTSATPTKTKLTPEQLEVKRHVERHVAKRRITDKEFLEIYD